MRITHLSLHNFRGFESLELDFDERLTVLVGENGSGKSTVLDAIACVLRGIAEPVTAWPPSVIGSLRRGAAVAHVGCDVVFGKHPPPIPVRVNLEHPGQSSVPLSYSGPGSEVLRSAPRNLPLFMLFRASRDTPDLTPGSQAASSWAPERAWDGALDAGASYSALFAWFREREDLENELRAADQTKRDRQLTSVRTAVERALPGYSHPRVRRPKGGADEHPLLAKPTFMIDKAGVALAFDQLSEGERVFIAMIADIARRLAIANTDGDPLEGRGVVMIDEIELHLHPKWQAQILDRLLGVFPNLQFIVTTHSPLVLTDVKRAQVRVLEGFEIYQPAHPVQGRDAGSILAEVFQTNPLPAETQDAVSQISSLIDADRFDEARAKLDELESKLGGLDVEVTRLRTAIDLLAS